jgi:uncharacterized membrane protein
MHQVWGDSAVVVLGVINYDLPGWVILLGVTFFLAVIVIGLLINHDNGPI